MRVLVLAALVAAIPAPAQPGTFDVTLMCKDEWPVVIVVAAISPGTITLELPAMMQACVEAMPTKSRWRAGA